MIAQIVGRGLGRGATIALLVTAGYAAVAQDLAAGPLTPPQIARLRGWQAPPFREAAREAAREVDAPAHAPRGGEGGTRQGVGRPLPTPLTALLGTARVADPGPDWAQVQTLAVLDAHRRAARAQAAADEEALLLMLVLLEVL